MYLSENKPKLLEFLETLGDPSISKQMQVVVAGSIMCNFDPILVDEVIKEYKDGWQGKIGAGCRIIARILQTL